MRRFLIDTDTASDDAVALIIALREPDIRARNFNAVWTILQGRARRASPQIP